jgi:hypothetical protein
MTAFDIGYASLTSIVSDTEATKVAAAWLLEASSR